MSMYPRHKRERSQTPTSPSPSPRHNRHRTQTLSSPSSASPLAPRRRERSLTPSSYDSDGGRGEPSSAAKRFRRSDLTVEVCKDFTRSVCKRSEIDCKFAHPHSAVAVEKDKVVACADSLRNKCYRGRTCRYYHPPPHIQGSLLKEIGVEDPKVEAICKDFLRGRCSRSAKNCRFAHHTPVDHQAVVCQDFMRGSCDRKSCRFSHVLVAEKMPEVCQDFIRGKCERRPCRYSHFVLPQMPEICQDFLRGRCERKTCRYSHVLVPEMSQAHLQPYGKPLELPQSPPRSGKVQLVVLSYHFLLPPRPLLLAAAAITTSAAAAACCQHDFCLFYLLHRQICNKNFLVHDDYLCITSVFLITLVL